MAGLFQGGMALVTVVAVPVGQALQGGAGGVPVTAAAGLVAAGFGAKQLARVGSVAPLGTVGRRLPVGSLLIVLARAAAPVGPGGLPGLLGGRGHGGRSGPAASGGPGPAMLGRRWVVQAVGTPEAVQVRSGRAPDPALLGVAGEGAEFGQQPSGRVKGQGALVDPAAPAKLAGDRLLTDPQLSVVGVQPAEPALLVAAEHAVPLGCLVGLAGGGL
jgi:hypothetical protein